MKNKYKIGELWQFSWIDRDIIFKVTKINAAVIEHKIICVNMKTSYTYKVGSIQKFATNSIMYDESIKL